MPQLDIYAFPAVVSWLIIIIFIFYNLILSSGLAQIYKILLYRKKKLEYYNNLKESMEKEVYYIIKMDNRFLHMFGKIYKFSAQNSNFVFEKSLDLEKDFLLKKTVLIKNWLEIRRLCLVGLVKDKLVDLVKIGYN